MTLQVHSYHLEERLSIPRLESLIRQRLIKKEPTYLFFELTENSYLYIKDFGSIVFINCAANFISATITSLSTQPLEIKSIPSETYSIKVAEDQQQNVGFSTIHVPELNANVVQVIAFNLAQSVAIDHYNNESIHLISSINSYTNELERKGNISLSFKEMRQFIGRTMNIKNRIVKNLYIFETTNLAWSDEQLSHLDNDLRLQLDIINRFNELQNNLNIVKENLDFIQAITQHKHSSKLEWIIIILILFEVVQILFEYI